MRRGALVLPIVLAFLSASAAPAPAADTPQGFPHTDRCLESAAAWAHVHPTLLRAIAWVESHDNPAAVHWNVNGSYDVGLMQVNSSWYYRGLHPWWSMLGHPCVNVTAAAWILKQCVDDHGYTWNAVGCYHAGSGWRQKPRPVRQDTLRYIQTVARVVAPPPGPAHPGTRKKTKQSP